MRTIGRTAKPAPSAGAKPAMDKSAAGTPAQTETPEQKTKPKK